MNRWLLVGEENVALFNGLKVAERIMLHKSFYVRMSIDQSKWRGFSDSIDYVVANYRSLVKELHCVSGTFSLHKDTIEEITRCKLLQSLYVRPTEAQKNLYGADFSITIFSIVGR